MHPESKIFGITVRGIIALVVVITVCAMSAFKVPVVEPLYTLVISVCSFYLGSRTSMMMMNGKNEPSDPGRSEEKPTEPPK